MAYNQPHKGSKIINPQTGRLVSVGGARWRKLVQDGYLPNTGYLPSNTFLDVYDSNDEKGTNYKIRKAKEKLPDGYTVSRGGGGNKGILNIVKKRSNRKEVLKRAGEAVAHKMKSRMVEEDSDMDIEDLKNMIQQAIEEEEATKAVNKFKKPTRKRPVKKYTKRQEPEPESESSDPGTEPDSESESESSDDEPEQDELSEQSGSDEESD